MPKGIKGILRIYTSVRGYWQQLSLWEVSDAQAEGEQPRSPGGPAPAQALWWLPHASTSAGKASFLWLREAVRSLKGFFCFYLSQSQPY